MNLHFKRMETSVGEVSGTWALSLFDQYKTPSFSLETLSSLQMASALPIPEALHLLVVYILLISLLHIFLSLSW